MMQVFDVPAAWRADDYRYRVTESRLSTILEDAQRPGHFDGVLTIVLKLLQIASTERAYFGEKDWQQQRQCVRAEAFAGEPAVVIVHGWVLTSFRTGADLRRPAAGSFSLVSSAPCR